MSRSRLMIEEFVRDYDDLVVTKLSDDGYEIPAIRVQHKDSEYPVIEVYFGQSKITGAYLIPDEHGDRERIYGGRLYVQGKINTVFPHSRWRGQPGAEVKS